MRARFSGSGWYYQRIARLRQFNDDFHDQRSPQVRLVGITFLFVMPVSLLQAGDAVPAKTKTPASFLTGVLSGTTGSGRQDRRNPRAVMRGAIYRLNC